MKKQNTSIGVFFLTDNAKEFFEKKKNHLGSLSDIPIFERREVPFYSKEKDVIYSKMNFSNNKSLPFRIINTSHHQPRKLAFLISQRDDQKYIRHLMLEIYDKYQHLIEKTGRCELYLVENLLNSLKKNNLPEPLLSIGRENKNQINEGISIRNIKELSINFLHAYVQSTIQQNMDLFQLTGIEIEQPHDILRHLLRFEKLHGGYIPSDYESHIFEYGTLTYYTNGKWNDVYETLFPPPIRRRIMDIDMAIQQGPKYLQIMEMLQSLLSIEIEKPKLNNVNEISIEL